MYPVGINWKPPSKVVGEKTIQIAGQTYLADSSGDGTYWIEFNGGVVEVRQDADGRWMYSLDGIQDIYFGL